MTKTMILAAVGMCLASCGTARVYRLPMDATSAPRTFSPIASVAQGMGLQYSEHDDSIGVRFDENTWIHFMIQNGAYNMVIVSDDKKLTKDQLEQELTVAKAKGDEIWQKALAAAGAVNQALWR